MIVYQAQFKRFYDVFAVKLGPKLSDTVKGKLRLGAKIIQEGGRENIFKQVFGMKEEEKLLKASQCYLSTTAGPIAGLLFSSTEKIAFCSERSIAVPSSTGQVFKAPYKVINWLASQLLQVFIGYRWFVPSESLSLSDINIKYGMETENSFWTWLVDLIKLHLV